MNGWIEKYRHKNPYIVVQNDKGSFKVAVNKLHYVETYKRNLLLHTYAGDVICYKNMKEMEKELSPYGFFRCHVGFLVNLAFVKNVEKLDVELTSGETVYVSKPKRKAFMEALAGYWGKCCEYGYGNNFHRYNMHGVGRNDWSISAENLYSEKNPLEKRYFMDMLFCSICRNNDFFVDSFNHKNSG